MHAGLRPDQPATPAAPDSRNAEGQDTARRGPHRDVVLLPFGYVACRDCRRMLNVSEYLVDDCEPRA